MKEQLYLKESLWRGKIFDGGWIESSGGQADDIEPATGSVLTPVGVADATDVREAASRQAWHNAIGKRCRSCFLAPGPRPPGRRKRARISDRSPKRRSPAARGFRKLRKSWSKVHFRSETKPGRRRSATGPENQIPKSEIL